MDNRRLGAVTALTGSALAVSSVLLMVAGDEIEGFPVGAWTGAPIVVSLVLLVMSIVFLSRSGERES